jgi:hypothetical protein
LAPGKSTSCAPPSPRCWATGKSEPKDRADAAISSRTAGDWPVAKKNPLPPAASHGLKGIFFETVSKAAFAGPFEKARFHERVRRQAHLETHSGRMDRAWHPARIKLPGNTDFSKKVKIRNFRHTALTPARIFRTFETSNESVNQNVTSVELPGKFTVRNNPLMNQRRVQERQD